MKRAASYRRVSTKMQERDGYSLPTQQLENAAYALQNNFKIVSDQVDDSTGYEMDRPGLNEVRRLARDGEIDAIIVYDSDRLTRNSMDYMVIRDELYRQGVELHYVKRGQVNLDDFSHQVIEDIMGRYAELERKKFRERTMGGKATAVRAGKVIGGRAPYGYTIEDKQLKIDPPAAEIVELIYRLYTEDKLSTKQIAKRLSEQGCPTYADLHTFIPKKKDFAAWNHNSVRQILINPVYCGVWYWGKWKTEKLGRKKRTAARRDKSKWLPVEVPAIVSRGCWMDAQEQVKKNSGRSTNIRHEYLLSRRLTCFHCGRPVYSRVQHAAGRDYSQMYYLCQGRALAELENCQLPYFRVDELDQKIWEWVIRVITDPDYLRDLLDESLVKDKNAQFGDTEQLQSIRGKMDEQKASLERLTRSYVSGRVDEEMFNKLGDEIAHTLTGLRGTEAEIISRIATGSARRARAMEIEQLVGEYQYGDDAGVLAHAPFAIRAEWVEALGLTAKLEVKEDGRRFAHLAAVVGSESIPVDETSYVRRELVWCISYTLELPPLKLTHYNITTE